MPSWTWHTGEVDPGQIVLVDMDGVISNAWHRQHFLSGTSRDWKGFFNSARDDEPILSGITLLDLLGDSAVVALVTARPDSILDDTVAWLREYDVRWELLIMRGRADHGPAPEMKRLAVQELRDAGYDPVLAIDDHEENIAMYEEEEIAAIYMHSGYYE